MGSRNRSRHPTFQVRASIFGRARVSFCTPNNDPTNLALRLRLYINFTVLYAPITRCCVPHALGSNRGRSFPSQGCNSVVENPCSFQGPCGVASSDWSQHNFRSLTPLPTSPYPLHTPPSPHLCCCLPHLVRYSLPVGPAFFTLLARSVPALGAAGPGRRASV